MMNGLEEISTKTLVKNSIGWIGYVVMMFFISLVGGLILLLPFRILTIWIGYTELLWVILVMLTIGSTSTVVNIWSRNVEAGTIVKKNLLEILEDIFNNLDVLGFGCVAIWVEVAVTFILGYFTAETYGLLWGVFSVIVITLLNDFAGKRGYSISSFIFKTLLRIRRLKVEISSPLYWFASKLVGTDASII